MIDESLVDAAKDSMKWWNRYYHLLLFIHFFLGILGVVIGAVIAADIGEDLTNEYFLLSPQFLGILSTVIVGIVSFVQPGRMASVFYDAYWRMRIEILRYREKHSTSEDLVEAIAAGFTTVATIQPEALQKHAARAADRASLNDARQKQLDDYMQSLLDEQKADDAEKNDGADPAETQDPPRGPQS